MEIWFEITHGQAADGTPWYAVVKYVGGAAMGADHHWLRPEYAENARSYYERGGRFPTAPDRIAATR